MIGLENPLHIALVLVVVLLVFGAKRLPEMGKSMGSGLRGFKQALSGEEPAESLTTTVEGPRAAVPGHAGGETTQPHDEPHVTPVG